MQQLTQAAHQIATHGAGTLRQVWLARCALAICAWSLRGTAPFQVGQPASRGAHGLPSLPAKVWRFEAQILQYMTSAMFGSLLSLL